MEGFGAAGGAAAGEQARLIAGVWRDGCWVFVDVEEFERWGNRDGNDRPEEAGAAA